MASVATNLEKILCGLLEAYAEAIEPSHPYYNAIWAAWNVMRCDLHRAPSVSRPGPGDAALGSDPNDVAPPHPPNPWAIAQRIPSSPLGGLTASPCVPPACMDLGLTSPIGGYTASPCSPPACTDLGQSSPIGGYTASPCSPPACTDLG